MYAIVLAVAASQQKKHIHTHKLMCLCAVPNALTLFATKFIDDFANQIQKMIYCHFKLWISASTRESY